MYSMNDTINTNGINSNINNAMIWVHDVIDIMSFRDLSAE